MSGLELRRINNDTSNQEVKVGKPVINVHLIDYDTTSPSGLRWSNHAHFRVAGKVAGSNLGYPYYRTKINGKLVPNHVHIYRMFYGEIPDGMQVDHIDGDKCNNTYTNLRLATNAQNQWNSKPNKNKKSGLPKNIVAVGNSFRAVIKKNKETYRSGCRKTVEECVEWLEIMRPLLHGEYSRGD